MVGLAMDESLEDEVAATRVAVRRVMQQLEHELTPAEYARMANIIFQGTNTVARLLRTNRSLSEDKDGLFAKGIGEGLNHVGGQYDLEL